MTNLDSILKSRNITLPTKFRLVKAMVFSVVMFVVTHFYFPGLTQDHFSDANCVPSGLAETAQL